MKQLIDLAAEFAMQVVRAALPPLGHHRPQPLCDFRDGQQPLDARQIDARFIHQRSEISNQFPLCNKTHTRADSLSVMISPMYSMTKVPSNDRESRLECKFTKDERKVPAGTNSNGLCC